MMSVFRSLTLSMALVRGLLAVSGVIAATVLTSAAIAQQPAAPFPPRPAGYEGVSDADLYLRLTDPIANARGPAAMEALNRLTPEERAWTKAFAQRSIDQYLADRDAGRLPAQSLPAAAPSAPTAAPVVRPAPPAPAPRPVPQRPGRCVSTGECYFAVVAHHGDERDAYQRSYDGTRLSWGIQVSNTASSGFSVPFSICGIQVYAPAARAEQIRGYMNPTSEAYVRRFSLSPHDGGFAICSWSPPRYTGPNR